MIATKLDIDCTGYANGDMFDSPEQVREYFTAENMTYMFGRPGPDDIRPTQDQLSEWAEWVIANRSHMR